MALVRLLLHCPIGMGCVSQAMRLGQGIAVGDDAPHQAALAGGLWSPLTHVSQRVTGGGMGPALLPSGHCSVCAGLGVVA